MKLMRRVLITMIFTGVLTGYGKKEEPASPPPAAKLGQAAVSLDGLTYVKGDPVTFAQGKVYVVEFWATWCAPCRSSIPHLTQIQKQFKNKGVTVIGVSSEEDLEKVKGFVTEQNEKMDYTVAHDPKHTVSDGYMKAYKQRGIPAAFIVDGKGNVVWVGHPMNRMEEVLEQVLAGTFEMDAYAKLQAERETASRKLGMLFYKYRTALIDGATIEETRPMAEEIIELSDPQTLNRLARRIILLPKVDDANRDLEMALKAATLANTGTNGKNPAILDTYALALSKTGKLAEAIAAQEKAITLSAGNEKMQADMKIRLEALKESLGKEITTDEAIPTKGSTN